MLTTVLDWFRRLIGPPPPSPPRVVELHNALGDLESRCDYLESELKSLRGRVTGAERRKKSLDDPSGATNEEEQAPQHPPERDRTSAHLARRFRSL